jgi:hypothetical protein
MDHLQFDGVGAYAEVLDGPDLSVATTHRRAFRQVLRSSLRNRFESRMRASVTSGFMSQAQVTPRVAFPTYEVMPAQRMTGRPVRAALERSVTVWLGFAIQRAKTRSSHE